MTHNKSIVITCQGTRGDVQPYVALSLALQSRGWGVVLGAPPEFEGFVSGYGVRFAHIGPSPSSILYKSSVSKEGKGAMAAYLQSVALFNPADKDPFTLTWFRNIFELVKANKPDILMLVFTGWCGAAVIPQLLGLTHTRVLVSLPMPLAPTGEFAVSMSGFGFSLPFAWLNRLHWSLSERIVINRIHAQAAKRILTTIIEEQEQAGNPLPGSTSLNMDKLLDTADCTALYCYSPALLPKPSDWPAHYHVTGQFRMPRKAGDSYKPLPVELQTYLDRCARDGQHVVYFGFGSLSFFETSAATAVFDAVAEAVSELSKSFPVRGVIQTTLSSTPGKTGVMSVAELPDSPFMCFSEAVDHSLLFPQVSLVMSHGGVGTVSAALTAGKPVMSMCCLPSADQSFWADLCTKNKLGPKWFWFDACTKDKVVARVKDGLDNLAVYTKNAEAMAAKMAKEDGLGQAMKILEEEVAKSRAESRG